MPIGRGKYDDACTLARKATGAAGVLLIVVEGKFGPGFSVQATPDVIKRLPALLRSLADGIERDIDPMKGNGDGNPH